MLLARLFHALDRTTPASEVLPSLASAGLNHLKSQGFAGPSASRRQQSGGAPRSGSSLGPLGTYSGIIPKTGVFIP
jgi:hypothetical protein